MGKVKLQAKHEGLDVPTTEEWYEFENDWVMRREYDTLTPNGNKMAGRWVLRNEKGEMVDFHQYRHDLADHYGLDIG